MATPQEPIVPNTGPEGNTPPETAPGVNPAWDDVLNVLPEQFHALVTPHFQKWDQASQGKIEDLNSKIESFNAFSPLVEHGITMEQINQSLVLAQEINANPRKIYDALEEAFNFANAKTPEGVTPTVEQVQQQMGNVPPELQEQVNLLSQLVIQEQQEKAEALESAKLDRELGAALEKFPDVKMDDKTEQYVLTRMFNGDSAEKAVEAFVDLRNSLAPAPFAPKVMSGSGGAVPSNAIDPRNLSRSDTRSLVAQLAKQAAEQGN